jgi:hypothetical protein
MHRLAGNVVPAALGTCGFLAIVAALGMGNGTAAAIASVCFLCSMATWKLGDLIVSTVFGTFGICQKAGEYTIVPKRDAIVKRYGGEHVASVFLGARIIESESDRDDASSRSYALQFEQVISSIKMPLKFSIMARPVDIVAYVDRIKARRGEAEEVKSRILEERGGKQSADIARIDREIEMWNHVLRKITSGQKPMEVAFFAMTSCRCTTQNEAVAKARAQAREAASAIGTSLNLDMSILQGEEMLECFELDRFAPENQDISI